jgi:transketolase
MNLRQIRRQILLSVQNADSGHLGPSLSCVEILYSVFKYIDYKSILRNRLILSKGHAAPALYAFYNELKMLKKNELLSLRKFNSRLQGHPDKRKLNFLDFGTGALGQGLSISIGYALGAKIKKKKNFIFCILGDGELQEGQIWEAAMFIGSNNLKNIITIIDGNKFQNDSSVDETMKNLNFKSMWKSFGFEYLEINGHDLKKINKSLLYAMNLKRKKPIVIYCNTIKGKGISFMENNNAYHSVKKLKSLEYEKAMNELN